MYQSIYGGIECCGCKISPKVNSIFTLGSEDMARIMDDPDLALPCKKCDGVGCDACMVTDNVVFYSRSAALAHLREHKKAGNKFPRYAVKRLRKELQEIGDTEGLEKPENPPSLFVEFKDDGTAKRLSKEEGDALMDEMLCG